jgi:phosphoribosylaminoimidazolecarboxamide formyltransferase/IMP cyclohydrolase
VKARRALISVFDKTGLADFVRELQRLDIEVVAADGTEQYLRDEGLEVKSVEQHIGAKAMAGGGSVKTMHPRLTQAILWGREAGELDEIDSSDDLGFDIVVMNLAPFERMSSRRDSREGDIVEAIDIDGPAIMRAAAKNFERVLIVADPEVYPIVVEELDSSGGDPNYELRKLLASRAFDCTAHYELAIANWFSEVEDFPTYLLRDYVKMADLPHGENPHQRAAYYVEVGARRHLLSMVEQVQGSDLTFNNLADVNVARQVTSDFTVPACAIVKHQTPAGVAIFSSIPGAFERAYDCSPGSVYGGVVSVNRTVDAKLAQAIAEHHFDVLYANDFTEDGLAVLAERCPEMRVLVDRERRKRSPGERDMHRVIGGLLVQDTDGEHEDREFMDVPTSAQPTEAQWGDLLFTWRVSKWVRSNAVVLGTGLGTVGIGGGTPSRQEAIEYALRKAGDRAKGSMMASDAFLGYDDAVQTAIDAGITGIIQPGGSRRDDEIAALCDAAGIPMVLTHRRHFRN